MFSGIFVWVNNVVLNDIDNTQLALSGCVVTLVLCGIVVEVKILKNIAKYLTMIAATLTLSACGGGSGDGSPTVAPPSSAPPPISYPLVSTPSGSSCVGETLTDVFETMTFETSHPINAKPWGCLIVNGADGQPVFDGEKSARFEVRPGDCSSNTGFNDCINDRSRHEINESGVAPTSGKIISWEERIYIPSQPRFRPSGRNIMFLTQINYLDNNSYGTLAYVEVAEDGALMIRTHVGLTFEILRKYLVDPSPSDKWIKLKFEVKSTEQPDGYLKIYADDRLIVDEVRQTLPSSAAVNWLKIGIYNAFKSEASQPYENQVVYYDGLKKVVANY